MQQQEPEYDPADGWFKLQDQNYQLFKLNNHRGEIRNVDMQSSLIAVSQWSGSIAATKDLTKVNISKLEDVLKESIVFFSNNGCQISRVPYKETDKIVMFDFLDDESLIVLKADGKYYICNPLNGNKVQYDLGEAFRKFTIIEGKVFGKGFVTMRMFVSEIEFHFVNDAYKPEHHEMCLPKLTSAPHSWVVVPPFYSCFQISFKYILAQQKLEVHIAHPEAGIIQLIENESRNIYYNETTPQLQIIGNIQMIALSPSYKFCCYLSFDPELANSGIPQEKSSQKHNWVLTALSNDFQQSTFAQIGLAIEVNKARDGPNKDPCITQRPNKIAWCADECVCIQQGLNLTLVGPYITEKFKLDSRSNVIFPEIDGLRIITQKTNSILRAIPVAYANIFEQLSQQPGAMLFTSYDQFEKGEPMGDDQLRSNKSDLAFAVNDCLQSSKFELDQSYQLKLLKASGYGRTFLPSKIIDHDQIQEITKILRIQNTLKKDGGPGARNLTYNQISWLVHHQEHFINLLLKYNLHYLAHEITKFMNFKLKLSPYIYTHWACCKVEQDEDDDKICQEITNKIKEESGVSFTEIANKAIDLRKQDLALKLLDNENSLAKRIPILIWMAQISDQTTYYYKRALDDALKSGDANLVYLVIITYMKSSKVYESYTFKLMSENIITKSYLLNYLKHFNEPVYLRYLEYQHQYYECAFVCIRDAYKEKKKISERVRLLQKAKEYLQKIPELLSQLEEKEAQTFAIKYDGFYYNQVQFQIETLADINKEKKSTKPPAEKPLNDVLEQFLLKNDIKIAEKFAQVYKIPERRFLLTQAKALMKNKKYEELNKLVAEKNRKVVILPYEILANLLIKQGEEERAYQMLLREPNVEESFMMFKRIGQFRYAAIAAINAKNFDLIEEVRTIAINTKDTALNTFIDTEMQRLQNKRK